MSGLCGALLRSRAEAEDAAQQTFLSAHRALLNGSEPLEPAAWLATIARNECLSRIRAQMRSPLPADAAETPTTLADPLAEAIRRADLVAIWEAIEALPRRQRDAILLREFGGLSYGELAVALAVTPPTVESLLFRARQRLRTQLRTLVASVGGAPWLETLARGFAGGAPVAAKVAALGVGAAAVTGGAVVAPDIRERSHRAPPPALEPAPRARPTTPRRVAALPAAAPVATAPVATATARVVQTAPDGSERRHRSGEGESGARPPDAAGDSSGSGDGRGEGSRDGAAGETRDGAALTVQAPATTVAVDTVTVDTVTVESSSGPDGEAGGGSDGGDGRDGGG